MVEKTTKIKFTALSTIEDEDNIYIGIPKDSGEDKFDALVSLLLQEVEVKHDKRTFIEGNFK